MIPEELLILISTPLYAVLIGGEMLLGHWHQRRLYTVGDTLTNVYLTSLNLTVDLATRSAVFLILASGFDHRWFSIQEGWVYWVLLFLGVDFAYYWLHRVDHYCRFFWAIHVTHHNSEEFNFTTGFRSSVFQPLYRFLYYLPLAFLGFRAEDILLMHSACQIYGILVHTQTVGKLGLLEYLLVTPSHHRVHHASNIPYLDRNMGMALIIWDKLFGTFAEEDPAEPVRFGLYGKPAPRGPVGVVFHEWQALWRDIHGARSWRDRFNYLFQAPGWSPDGRTLTADQLRAGDKAITPPAGSGEEVLTSTRP